MSKADETDRPMRLLSTSTTSTSVRQHAAGMISVRLVTMDHYMAPPINADLDPVYSNFRSSVVTRVPVLRVFGPTLAGQKTCLHLHGIFPYMYVPKPAGVSNSYMYQLAASIDKAINISTFSAATGPDAGHAAQNRRLSVQQHVYKASRSRSSSSFSS